VPENLFKRIVTSFIISFIFLFFLIKGGMYFIFFLLLVYILSILEWIKLSNNRIIFIIGLLFLSLSLTTALMLRNNNFSIFILIILISISSDIGGYAFGKIFRGPKLTKISPNKTYSGMLGSYIVSIILGFIYLNYIKKNFQLNNEIFTMNLSIFYIVLISSINQFGDLVVSYFKRLKKLNDTGNILPGHGGILDRIDGMIFAIPLGYIINDLIL